MAGSERWIFSRSQLANTPSRKHGTDADKELYYRQQTANFIQDMGQRLQVYPSQYCLAVKIEVTCPRAHFQHARCSFCVANKTINLW